jgi:hypothetical protein
MQDKDYCIPPMLLNQSSCTTLIFNTNTNYILFNHNNIGKDQCQCFQLERNIVLVILKTLPCFVKLEQICKVVVGWLDCWKDGFNSKLIFIAIDTMVFFTKKVFWSCQSEVVSISIPVLFHKLIALLYFPAFFNKLHT